MKQFHLKQNKFLLVQTIILISVVLLVCLLSLYSMIFEIFNDYRRQNYDDNHLFEIYETDREKFNTIVSLINKYNIETISHGFMIDKTENYFYLDTLYYQTNSDLDNKELNAISTNAYYIFDNYDFDVIENDNSIITFTYCSANIELVYDTSCNKADCGIYYKKVDDNWFVNIL